MIIFANPKLKQIKSNLLSSTTIIIISIILFTFSFPFFLVFSTDNFWSNINISYIQPSISYKGKYIIEIIDDKNNLSSYSSFSNMNKLVKNLLSPSLSYNSYDNNNDDLNDVITLLISIPYKSTQSIRSIKLMILLDFELNDNDNKGYAIPNIYSESLVLFQFYSYNSNGLSMIKTSGKLNINQKSPIDNKPSIININTNENSENSSQKESNSYFKYDSVNSFNLYDIYSYYKNKNITISYNKINERTMSLIDEDTVVIDINMEIPLYQEVAYVPFFAYSLKMSWIQYFCTLCPILAINYFVIYYCFEYGILKGCISNSCDICSNDNSINCECIDDKQLNKVNYIGNNNSGSQIKNRFEKRKID